MFGILQMLFVQAPLSDHIGEDAQGISVKNLLCVIAAEAVGDQLAQMGKAAVIPHFQRAVDPVKVGAEGHGFDSGMVCDVLHVPQNVLVCGICGVRAQKPGIKVHAAHAAPVAKGAKLLIREIAAVVA